MNTESNFMESSITIHNSQYTTNNIALAAYLHSEGYKEAVDTSGFPTIFKFKTDFKLDDFVHKYECGKASCNPKQFYESYKYLISRLKDNGNNEPVQKRLF